MTPFEKLVVRLLAAILSKLLMVPGVATYEGDEELISDAEEAAVGNIVDRTRRG